ncbi:hypothetical protein O3G_MSEX003038 [Manduca sexta]|uniref:Uncharacterized protein n=1 Tax=Manduca sexta TaxID=7130 RepID=A0A921YQZ0_MANSE|nr:hypothetical protein O3G_MSEX003038 [Manduca sexta]
MTRVEDHYKRLLFAMNRFTINAVERPISRISADKISAVAGALSAVALHSLTGAPRVGCHQPGCHYCMHAAAMKWAARGGAGVGGSPPRGSQSLADTLAASTREPRCTSPTLDAFSLGPRVYTLSRSDTSGGPSPEPRTVQYPQQVHRRTSGPSGACPAAAPPVFASTSTDPAGSARCRHGPADRRVYCLRAHGTYSLTSFEMK